MDESLIKTIHVDEYPFLLKQIPSKPKRLHIAGELPPEHYKYLCVIGSRTPSSYGREVCRELFRGLRRYPIAVVSGLAYGIDSAAHEAALEFGLKTVSFPGSGLAPSVIYPQSHLELARKIVDSGGALISAFPHMKTGGDWTFPYRNRLMAGISAATLIIEARHGSGTLLTAKYAEEFDRDVLVVPGSIFSDLSYGPHMLLQRGATPICTSEDLLEALGFTLNRDLDHLKNYENLTREESLVLDALNEPKNKDELFRSLSMPTARANIILSQLELKDLVIESEGRVRRS